MMTSAPITITIRIRDAIFTPATEAAKSNVEDYGLWKKGIIIII